MKQNEITAENGKPTTNTGEIILYQPDNSIRLEVRMEEETVWLTQAQMAMLFETSRNNITLHIKNIFKEGELEETAVCKDFLLTAADGKTLDIERHNLQYPSVTARECDRFHDRFLIIDDTVYHLGASLKDLGKKLFAFSRMDVGGRGTFYMITPFAADEPRKNRKSFAVSRSPLEIPFAHSIPSGMVVRPTTTRSQT